MVIPAHCCRTWTRPVTALMFGFRLIELGLNTGNKWPLLDADFLFTSGYFCSRKNPPSEQVCMKYHTLARQECIPWGKRRKCVCLVFFSSNCFSGAALICFSAQKLWRWRGLLDYFFLTSLCSFQHCFYPPVGIIFLNGLNHILSVLMSPVTVVRNDAKSNDL